jgi:hypothetical protein
MKPAGGPSQEQVGTTHPKPSAPSEVPQVTSADCEVLGGPSPSAPVPVAPPCWLPQLLHALSPFPTFSSISLAVCLVVSKFSTKAVSPRKFPDAADRRARRESSSSFRTILNSF